MGKLKGKEQEIVEKYKSGLSTTKLANIYNVRSSSILKLLRRNNTRIRRRVETRLISQANYKELSKETLDSLIVGGKTC